MAVKKAKLKSSNGSNGEGVPDVSTIKNAATRKKISSLCSEYRNVQEQITDLENIKKALMADIRDAAERNKIEKVAGDTWVLSRTSGTRSKISPEKLLEKGVKMQVIEAATVITPYSYYQVRNREQ